MPAPPTRLSPGRTALAVALFALAAAPAARGDGYARPPVDVLHYDVALSFLPDFEGYEATGRLDVRLLEAGLRELRLDFDGPHVDGVAGAAGRLAFRHEAGRLFVQLPEGRPAGAIVRVAVEYHGRPGEAGLRAARNAHGRLTLFADNWPDNARRWLPCVDHPSDKATVDFTVTAEDRYDVVAPGRLVETRSLLDGRRTTRWSEGIPIPTYGMVVGAAEFAVAQAGSADGVPVSVLAYPDDAEAAAAKFARTSLVLEALAGLVAPFPFEKLAQVVSSSRFGGMENPSAIFYAEETVHGRPPGEDPVAHEVAHQWWGDSVTPADWPLAVIEPQSAPAGKLNAFTYDKGAWVLHMLRRRVGDGAFFRSLRALYRARAGGNATTADLCAAVEAETGADQSRFFEQWLKRRDLPELRVAWRWEEAARAVAVEVEQTQPGEAYDLDVDLAFDLGGGRSERRTVAVRARRETLRLELPTPPSALSADPDGWLLAVTSVLARDEAAPSP